MRGEKLLYQCSAHTEAKGFQEHRRHHGRASNGIPGFTIEHQKEGHDTSQGTRDAAVPFLGVQASKSALATESGGTPNLCP